MTRPNGFGAIQRNHVADAAISQVKELILTGALRPGDRLPPEHELAEQLGVSRPTIRESLRALAAMNIVETRHGAGTYVTSLEPRLLAEPIDFLMQVNFDAIHELFEARRVLEAGCVRLAAQRVTPDGLAELERLTEEYGANLDNLDACVRLDIAFHKQIADVADNSILASMLDSVTALARASRERTGSDRAVRLRAHADHEDIVRALAAGDPAAAEAAMLQHLKHVADGLRPKRRAT